MNTYMYRTQKICPSSEISFSKAKKLKITMNKIFIFCDLGKD